MMASHDALWAKLHELELQLAAYKLLRTARREEAGASVRADDGAGAPGRTCRGRQYDAYMRRRDARRVAASAEQQPAKAARGTRAAGRSKPMRPRALKCTARDAQELKRTPTVSIPSTLRWDSAALQRSRTVNGGAGATGSPARSHHQRQNSLGVPTDFGDIATPRQFLKRGTGTGGAVASARLRTPRVHDLQSINVASTPRQLQQELAPAHAARHVRTVSELPFDTVALSSQQARATKRWGSPEKSAAMFSAAAAAGDSHRDFSKGLKKLLSFVRKGSKGTGADRHCAAPSPGRSGKPVSKGWSASSLVDVPFDRANLDGHRLSMTRAIGISG
ncbi:uncharacterized protein LOC133901927 isoform X2 [Phragmites australis]|uniref:uncharacterized protein LOC133901927 isoform X2 n=1 Tax=Phragmites australis TaxID=29695 RepID=UPI002D78C731|nr:uncharacterized protein LOC133901927 isoform X2 [Phragmites australis]